MGLGSEEQCQLRYLLHAVGLRAMQAGDEERRYQRILGLHGEPTEADLAAAAKLLPRLLHALGDAAAQAGLLDEGLPVAEVAALLRREQLNSYGILAHPQQQAADAHHPPHTAAAAAAPPPEAASEANSCVSSTNGPAAAPPGPGPSTRTEGTPAAGERRLRGSALYSQASLINHECAPNVARYDAFDSPAAGPGPGSGGGGGSAAACWPTSTHIVFRAMHDLPAGTELFQSYCPLHWGLAERQQQCKDVYGFACTCPRCQTESQWSDDEEGDDDDWETDSASDGGGEAAMGMEDAGGGADAAGTEEEPDMADVQGPIVAAPGEEGPLEPAYLRLFLLKYICPKDACFGTMALQQPGSQVLECSVCGGTRTEQEFLEDLERSMGR